MSLTENDRKIRSPIGTTFPQGRVEAIGSAQIREAISAALRRDFSGSPGAVKHVARLLDANDRAVRNWFDGRNGPSGEHLVRLMAHSPAVVETVLTLSGRDALISAQLVKDAQARLLVIVAMLGDLDAARLG